MRRVEYDMPSTAQTYRDAAKENLLRAQESFDDENYFLAHYLFGLAVECHLRAYLRKKTHIFDSGHDLRDLANESGFYDIVPADQADEFAKKFAILNLRWRSNHRYYSERQFLDYMAEIKAEFNRPGNRWKNLARAVQNRAYDIINQGEAKWARK
jgi:HEPN domain-containing protein